MQARRQHPTFEGEGGLDQARHPGGRVQVADVGLHRAQGTEPRIGRARPEGLRQGRHLDRVAERGAGAVGLHIRYGARVDAGQRVGGNDDVGLSVDARRGVAHLRSAVVVEADRLDHRVDVITVAQRGVQALERDDADPVPEHGARRRRIEGPTMAIARADAALLIAVRLVLRKGDRNTAREGDVALVGQQALPRQPDGDQRGGAARLDRHAGPTQVELVGHPGGQKVRRMADHGLQIAEPLRQFAMRHDLSQEIGPRTHAGEHPDQAGKRAGIIPRVLQCLPGGLEEDPMLRIHDLRFIGCDTEEAGIEKLRLLQHPARSNKPAVPSGALGRPPRKAPPVPRRR